ncbi:hypothetical protein G7Y89_g8443 [Cudoniella acicularis]|uniref:Bromo domain-containing protein n=1 Tax=Cudoniella acicularis TaxID=354080 RepID=A0A8H4W3J8_9HELO|nr:hypothetical protein G7Y89_g8443 [Cudoniella acicularis]
MRRNLVKAGGLFPNALPHVNFRTSRLRSSRKFIPRVESHQFQPRKMVFMWAQDSLTDNHQKEWLEFNRTTGEQYWNEADDSLSYNSDGNQGTDGEDDFDDSMLLSEMPRLAGVESSFPDHYANNTAVEAAIVENSGGHVTAMNSLTFKLIKHFSQQQKELGKFLLKMQDLEDAWPFLTPMLGDSEKNLDFSTMKVKVKRGGYPIPELFIEDATLIFDHSRNDAGGIAICAGKMEKSFNDMMLEEILRGYSEHVIGNSISESRRKHFPFHLMKSEVPIAYLWPKPAGVREKLTRSTSIYHQAYLGSGILRYLETVAFEEVRGIVPRSSNGTLFMSTNKGIHLQLPLKQLDDRTFLAILYYHFRNDDQHMLAIPLGVDLGEQDSFARVPLHSMEKVDKAECIQLKRRDIYVRGEHGHRSPIARYAKCLIRLESLVDQKVSLLDSYPAQWLQPNYTASVSPRNAGDLFGAIIFQTNSGIRFALAFKTAKELLSVNAEVLHEEETAKGVFNSFETPDAFRSLFDSEKSLASLEALLDGTTSRREWKHEGDRILRGFRDGTLAIATRKQIISGDRLHVIEISYARHDSDSEMKEAEVAQAELPTTIE